MGRGLDNESDGRKEWEREKEEGRKVDLLRRDAVQVITNISHDQAAN
jgi:hypothetical protein